MFDPLINRFKQLESGVPIPVSLALDDDGYLDRVCHSSECGAEFKVLWDDWRSVVRDEAVFCPTCRFEAPATDWNTEAQQAQIRDAALRYVQGEVAAGLADSSRTFNRAQPRAGFVTLRLSHRLTALPVVLPASAAQLLQQRWDCEICRCRYASLGAAFFCPSCGHNSAAATFEHTIATVRRSLDAIPQLAGLLERGEANDLARRVVEDGVVKLIGTFQRFAEATYAKLQGVVPARGNVFQTVGEASELWRAAIGVGYEDLLTAAQLRLFTRYVQQRHVLTHSDGLVDQAYLDRSHDASYRLGQRIVVRPEDTRALADLLTDLARAVRARL
jgi:hypothetical protein